MSDKVDVSVLVPVLNEEESLQELNERLVATLEAMGKGYEIIYINDGSTDDTQRLIEGFHQANDRIKVIEFNRNYGQHMALFAGFERAVGQTVVTIDADLQNPPEEIQRLVEKAEEGYDVVATYRKGRQDSIFRTIPSWVVNKITSRLVGAKLRDYGCMLRAYSRNVVDSMNMCQESSSFIPALANTYAKRIVEIEVAHNERKKGVSKYGLFRLLRLNFDLMTGFSLYPIQFISIIGVLIAIIGLGFALFLLVRRLVLGPESEGLFTLFAILFFFIGVQIFALGVTGEYIGRHLSGGTEKTALYCKEGAPLKAVVFGYHEVGYVCLEELIKSKIEVAALFTHQNDPEEELWFRTPRVLAEEHGIPVFEPQSVRDSAWIEKIRAFSPDYLFSFYYRNMLPGDVLDIPRIAPLNLHGSLLPKFRGRCPVNWVLVKGEEKTGVTLHIMEVKPDAGDIVAQKSVDISFEDTAHTLFLKLASAARELMQEVLPLLESATFKRTPQAGTSSYYGGRKPVDGIIDWQQDAVTIYNLVRAVTHPYPGAFTFFKGKKLFIWKALPEKGRGHERVGAIVSTNPLLVQTGEGLLRLTSVQLEDENETGADGFLALHNLDKECLGGTF